MGHDFNMGMECDATPEWHAPFRFSEAWKERLPDSVRCLASFFDASGSRPMAGRWSVTRGNGQGHWAAAKADGAIRVMDSKTDEN
jgi:hypothetical protein